MSCAGPLSACMLSFSNSVSVPMRVVESIATRTCALNRPVRKWATSSR